MVDHFPTVLTPWGENCRYDFVVETDEGQLLRIQCKTGRLRDGAVRFPPRSLTYHHPLNRRTGPTDTASRDYRGQADLFGVYCVETGKVYLVPVDEVPTTLAALRTEPTRNGQKAGIRWAAQYELCPPE